MEVKRNEKDANQKNRRKMKENEGKNHENNAKKGKKSYLHSER